MASAEFLNRRVIAISGPERHGFLQGLITNDIAECQSGRAIYAGLLTPQGKLLFDFFITPVGDELWLDCAAATIADLTRRLNFYRLRAQVTIAAKPELSICAVWGDEQRAADAGLVTFPDPRLTELGVRIIGLRGPIEQKIAGFAPGNYRAHRISLGVPDSEDLPPDQVFALDAGFEELHGVSFSKGCYVGQEVTSRMKHRATARRRFLTVEAGQAIAPGAAIDAGGLELGRVTSAVGNTGLALVRIDRFADAEQNAVPISAAGAPVTLRRPGWLHV